MEKLFIKLCLLTSLITQDQISPLLNHDWTIEKIVTEEQTLTADLDSPDYMYIESFEGHYEFWLGDCGFGPIFNDQEQSFDVEYLTCTLGLDESASDIVIFFYSTYFSELSGDESTCFCPFTYDFREEEDKIYLDITNSNGDVATFFTSTLSNTNFEKVELSIYPNPTSNVLHISTNSTNVLGVELFNLQGKSIKQASLNNEANIDVSDLSNGSYFLKITTPEGELIKKFLKE